MLAYESQKQDDGLNGRLIELVGERRRFDYRRLHILISGQRSLDGGVAPKKEPPVGIDLGVIEPGACTVNTLT